MANQVGADIAMKHVAGALTGASRLRLADLINDESPSVYVLTRATRLMQTPSHVLLPHRSSQSTEVFTIEIPMTFIPVDLAMYAPKEELVRNSDLMRLLNIGVLELISSERAEELMNKPEAVAEYDRLVADRQAKIRSLPGETKDDAAFRAMHPDLVPQAAQPGQLNAETASVSVSVVSIFTNTDYSDEDRLVMLTNIQDILTDEDRRYIRNKTRDPRVLKLIG